MHPRSPTRTPRGSYKCLPMTCNTRISIHIYIYMYMCTYNICLLIHSIFPDRHRSIVRVFAFCLSPTICYAMPRYATLCYAMLRYATLCYAMLRYATLCYAMLRYATLCYAMLRYATLCYAMLRYAMLSLCVCVCVCLCCNAKTSSNGSSWNLERVSTLSCKCTVQGPEDCGIAVYGLKAQGSHAVPVQCQDQ